MFWPVQRARGNTGAEIKLAPPKHRGEGEKDTYTPYGAHHTFYQSPQFKRGVFIVRSDGFISVPAEAKQSQQSYVGEQNYDKSLHLADSFPKNPIVITEHGDVGKRYADKTCWNVRHG